MLSLLCRMFAFVVPENIRSNNFIHLKDCSCILIARSAQHVEISKQISSYVEHMTKEAPSRSACDLEVIYTRYC